MNSREFIRRAQRYARRHRLEFHFDASHGKGSHGMIHVGNRRTIVQHGEISRGVLSSMLRELEIDRRRF